MGEQVYCVEFHEVKLQLNMLVDFELEFDLDVTEWNQSGEFRAEKRASRQMFERRVISIQIFKRNYFN